MNRADVAVMLTGRGRERKRWGLGKLMIGGIMSLEGGGKEETGVLEEIRSTLCNGI